MSAAAKEIGLRNVEAASPRLEQTSESVKPTLEGQEGQVSKEQDDIETLGAIANGTYDDASPSIAVVNDLADNSQVPHLSLLALFWKFFYQFGCFAWGGPVAQIALIKQILVEEEKWISIPRFQRVFAVYQIVPGPEAAELCMFFGCLSNGRLGGLVAGLGFMLPGFMLMLLASWAYARFGLGNAWVSASFRGVQPVVAAMILKAVHKLSEHTFPDHKTKKINYWLVGAAFFTAINTALRINIFISLAFYGLLNILVTRRLWLPLSFLFVAQYVGFALYCAYRGIPKPVSLAIGIAKTPSLQNLFLLGLVSGSLSFGGAYTAIPFIQVEAVLLGKWLSQSVFIDCIAIGNVLPAPLVIFATFVGYQGALEYGKGSVGYAFAGAVVITIGMWFPCFFFVILGHELLEKLVRNKFLAAFFDGLVGSVIGIIAIVAMQILQGSIISTRDVELKPDDTFNPENLSSHMVNAARSGISAVLYMLALVALYRFASNKYAVILVVIAAAIAGQFLFINVE